MNDDHVNLHVNPHVNPHVNAPHVNAPHVNPNVNALTLTSPTPSGWAATEQGEPRDE